MMTKNEELEALRLPELQAKYAEVVGEQTRAPNRKFLVRKITEATEARGAAETDPEGEGPAVEEKSDPQENGPTEAPETGIAEAPAEAEASEPEVALGAGPEPALETETEGEAPEGEKELSKTTPTELRARYRELVGRESRSSNRRYLIWRCQQAAKGRIPVGPRKGRGGEPVPMKVLPVRVPEEAVATLDEAWKRLGISTRTEFFRRAAHAFLEKADESEAAALFAASDAE